MNKGDLCQIHYTPLPMVEDGHPLSIINRANILNAFKFPALYLGDKVFDKIWVHEFWLAPDKQQKSLLCKREHDNQEIFLIPCKKIKMHLYFMKNEIVAMEDSYQARFIKPFNPNGKPNDHYY